MPLLDVAKILGIALAVYLFLRFLLPFTIPFLFAFLLAKWLNPIIQKIHKKLHIKTGILTGIALCILLVLLIGIFWILGTYLFRQLRGLGQELPRYWEKTCEICHGCCEWIEGWTGSNPGVIENQILGSIPQIWSSVKGKVVPAVMIGSVSWIRGIALVAGVGVVTGIATLLILKDYGKIREGLKKRPLGKVTLTIARRVYGAAGGYVKAQLLIMLVVTTICVIGLFCTGNSYAFLAGAGIGLCDALPFLGTGTILIPWAVIQLVQGKYLLAASYAVIYTIATLSRELLEPKLVGGKLGIPPLAVVFSVYVGLWIYGVWGFALGPVSYILIREIWEEVIDR